MRGSLPGRIRSSGNRQVWLGKEVTGHPRATTLLARLLGRRAFGEVLAWDTFLTFPAGPQRPFHPSLSPAPGAYPRVPGGPETPQASLCAYQGGEQTCLSVGLPLCCPAEPPSGRVPHTMAGSPLRALQVYLAEPPVKAIHTRSSFRHWSQAYAP